MTRTTIASPTQRWSASSGSAAQTAIASTTARTAILMISPAGELVPSAARPNLGGFFSGGVSVASLADLGLRHVDLLQRWRESS